MQIREKVIRMAAAHLKGGAKSPTTVVRLVVGSIYWALTLCWASGDTEMQR